MGACEVLPLLKGRGAEKGCTHAEGGGGGWHNKFGGSFYMAALSFSHIEGGGAQKVSTLSKVRCERFYPVLRGGDARSFGTGIFPFCSPPSP